MISCNPIYHAPIHEFGLWNSLTRRVQIHPRKSLTVQAALAGTGIFSLIASRQLKTAPVWVKTATILTQNTALAAAFGLAATTVWQWKHLFGQIFYGILNFSYQPNYTPAIFEPRQFKDAQGLVLAEMKYHQHLPILSFHPSVTDPKHRGYIEGLLMGDYLESSCRMGLQPMLTYLEWEKGQPGKIHLQNCLQNLTFSKAAEQEIEGLCGGFKERNRKLNLINDLDVETLLKAAHIVGDAFKAVGTNLACSTMVCKDNQGNITVGRNLDWPSMGHFGKHLFIREYSVSPANSTERIKIKTLTFPGYAGALTAWNDNGLLVIINELGRVSRGQGMPYSIIAKRLVEECSSVEEAKTLIRKIQKETPCASSVSLILADMKHAAAVHFYPEDAIDYVVRDIQTEGALFVTNHYENEAGQVVEKSICELKTVRRSDSMKQACEKHMQTDASQMVEEALKAAGVSNTILAFIANQSEQTKKIAFDNFSAHQLLEKTQALQI